MTLSLADGSCLDAVILLLNPAREQGEQGPVAPVAHEIERALAVPAPEGRLRVVGFAPWRSSSPPRLKNCAARSCFKAAARVLKVPRLRRCPVRGSFFR